MSESLERAPQTELSEQMARLESRISRLEGLLGNLPALNLIPPSKQSGSSLEADRRGALPDRTITTGSSAEEFEFEVGQNWFAKAGIVALAAGAAFALSLPFDNLPRGVPSLAGYTAVLLLFLLAHLGSNSFDLVSRYFRGAGMALLYISTLRLYFFGAHPLLAIHSIVGEGLLTCIVAVNMIIAYRRQSPYLLSLALLTGYATVIAVNTPPFVLFALATLAAVAVHARVTFQWVGVLLFSTVLTWFTYFNWAANNPLLSHRYLLLKEPSVSLLVILVCLVILAAGSILRRDREEEDTSAILSTLLNCSQGYAVFLAHSLAFPAAFTAAHLTGSVILLGIAVVFWLRERSKVATFIYAMTGYMALSVAIIKASAVPEVFVWLSLQSLLVVTTAIWFQSRFIVVANFLIYVGIVTSYIIVAQRETGISVGLGVVALISARILNWQRDRLHLQTELMRNAYLFSAFAIFPYALFHLVRGAYVALAWVGVALFYYLMNLIVRNQKYRWMGHATLLLAALYLLIVGTSRFEPLYRILSFFVLGTVLLMVSLIFTRIRNRQRKQGQVPEPLSSTPRERDAQTVEPH